VLAAGGRSLAQDWSHDPSSELGPEHWGELGPAYRTCGAAIDGFAGFQQTGRKQSPIDLETTTPERLPNLVFAYQPTPLEIENTGHVVEVPYQPGSELVVGDDVYQLLQFHFHAPSEHTVSGRSSPMELHLVHQDNLGTLAVVGVLLEIGAQPNASITEIFEHAPGDEGSTETGGAVDARDLLPRSRGYYTYSGSLTTPPCTEGVRWFLLRRPVQVSAETVEAFHALIGDFPGYDGFEDDNRPVRPLNGRAVLRKR
jgi:carbonic anhydrase